MNLLNYSRNKVKQLNDIIFKWENTLLKKRVTYYLVYTIIFSIICSLVFAVFILQKRSFVYQTDGMNQHFQAVQYFGEYLRQIIKNFISTGKISFPMWDLKVGMGLDIIQSLNYYSIGDPLDILYVFISSKYTEFFYNFLIILRLYLAGITFSVYSFRMKKDRYSTLIGACIYSFCGFALFASIRHPFFINPMIYFPLIILGVEKILKKEKAFLFIVIIAISAANSFYFLYTCTIFAVLYALMRYFYIHKKIEIKKLCCTIFKFSIYYFWGICISAVLFIPAVMSVLNSTRIGEVESNNLGFYNLYYYINLFKNFLRIEAVGSWTIFGYSSICFLSIISLFIIKKNQYMQKRIVFIILSVFLLFPIAGFIFNGFGYVTNRWIFIYSFAIAYITTSMIPELLKLDNKSKSTISLCTIIYCLIFATISQFQNEHILHGIVFLLCYLILLYLNTGIKIKVSRFFRVCLVFILIIEISSRAWGFYSPNGSGYSKNFLTSGEVNSIIQKYSYNIKEKVKQLDNDDIFRTGVINSKVYNYGLTQNVNTVSTYFSVLDSDIVKYSNEVGNAGLDASCRLADFNNRTALNTLASVKYFAVKKDELWKVPYGYKQIEQYKVGKEIIYLFENMNNLPLGYTYSSYISKEEFDKLSTNEREQAMIQGIVIDDKVNLPETDLKFNYNIVLGKDQIQEEIRRQIQDKYGSDASSQPIEIQDDKIVVKKPGESIELNIDGVSDSENYFSIEGLKFLGKNQSDFKDYYLKNSFSKFQEFKFDLKYKFNSVSSYSNLKLESDNRKVAYTILAPYHYSYANSRNILINLGYSKDPIKKVKITFSQMGEYYYDDFKIVSQPMDRYKDSVSTLKNDALQNIKIEGNRINGQIKLDKAKMLCLSIPYSNGWRAKVNGQEVPVIKANVMYMGIMLDKGENEIQLIYRTPGIKLSLVISLLSVLMLVLYFIIDIYNTKKQ